MSPTNPSTFGTDSSSAAVYFVVPGDINTRTGGYRYDKRILEGLRERGLSVELISLEGSFPFPNADELELAGAQLARLPDQALTVIDGLAFSVMPEQLAEQQHRLRLLALIHHPLALETGNSETVSARLMQSERQALRLAYRVITTSATTSRSLVQDYDVPEPHIKTVCPGSDPAPVASGSPDDTTKLLCVATLTQRKAHRVLLDALAQIRDLPWTLDCPGSTERDVATAQALSRQRRVLQLEDRISFPGEIEDDALDRHYQQADLFVLSSLHEGYGMVLDEAIARGLPIIASNAGAIAQTIPEGAGLLFPPGDATALAELLRQFMQDTQLRDSLRAAAREARKSVRSWQQASTEFEAALPW